MKIKWDLGDVKRGVVVGAGWAGADLLGFSHGSSLESLERMVRKTNKQTKKASRGLRVCRLKRLVGVRDHREMTRPV